MKRSFLILACVIGLHATAFAEGEVVALSLQRVLQLARERSSHVLAANERVTQSISRIDQARTTLYPQLSASVGQTRQTRNLAAQGIRIPRMDEVVGPFNSFDARVKVTQILFDGSAIQRLKLASAGKTFQEAEQKKLEQDVLLLAGQLYVEAKRAEQARKLPRFLLDRDEMALRLAQTQHEVGSGSAFDRSQAEARVAQSREQQQAADKEAVERRLDLAALLGFSPETVFEFDNAELSAWKEFALDAPATESVDVASSKQTLLLRQLEGSILRRDLWPRATVSADYGASGSSLPSSRGTYTYGGQLAVPIWEGGLRQQRVKESESIQREAQIGLRHAENETAVRTAQAADALEKTRALLRSKHEELRVMNEQMVLAQTRLKVGSGSAWEIKQLAAQQASVRNDREEAAAAVQLALLQYARATGQLDRIVDTQISKANP